MEPADVFGTGGVRRALEERRKPRPGSGPGEFTTPHAIWVDRSERVLVADRENNRVQVFDRDGRFLEMWGDLYHPMDIAEDDRA